MIARSFNDYYPFGLTFNEYQNQGELGNDFLFNGMELQSDLNLGWYDFKFRMYDPAIGRFGRIDPLSGHNLVQSPYVYADNNPIKNIDVLGLDSVDPNKSDADDNSVNLIDFSINGEWYKVSLSDVLSWLSETFSSGDGKSDKGEGDDESEEKDIDGIIKQKNKIKLKGGWALSALGGNENPTGTISEHTQILMQMV